MDLLFENFSYFINVYFSISFPEFIFSYAICCVILILISKKIKFAKKIMIPFVALYYDLLVIATLLCDNRSGQRDIILDPFYGAKLIFLQHNVHFLRGMLSNIILFIPAGIFFLCYFRINSLKQVVLYASLSSLIIEACQYVFSIGCFETEDIICNVVGAISGYMIMKCIIRLFRMVATKFNDGGR